jgi:hypothetical protein
VSLAPDAQGLIGRVSLSPQNFGLYPCRQHAVNHAVNHLMQDQGRGKDSCSLAKDVTHAKWGSLWARTHLVAEGRGRPQARRL